MGENGPLYDLMGCQSPQPITTSFILTVSNLAGGSCSEICCMY